MRFVSLFSGVGGFDLGLEAAGMTCAAQVEWDRHCQRVLRRHWPDVPKWEDVADVNGADLPEVDLIAFGSPCQDLSVAGRRAGFDGDRSVLFYEATRIIREMRDASGGRFPAWAVWENVAGALSSTGGRDFAAVTDDLADAGALVLEWAVLDARWFGVPQRRRRVFLVACFDPRAAEQCPDPLLPVGPRVRRHPGEGVEAGQVVAALTRNGVGGGGGADDNAGQAGHLIPALTTRCGNTQDDQQVGQLVPFVKAKRAQSDTDDETWDLAGPDRPAPTLNAMDNGTESRATVGEDGDPAPTVTSVPSAVAYALAQRGRGDGTDLEVGEPDIYNTLRAGDGGSSRQQQVLTPELAVRRLTPRECERLMGWPDDHTRWADDDTELADSHRYRQCGNGVAAPVAEWVARQILGVDR